MNFLDISRNGSELVIGCRGEWTLHHISKIEKEFLRLRFDGIEKVVIDTEAIENFDSAGMLLLKDFDFRISDRGIQTRKRGITPKQKKMLDLVEESYTPGKLPERRENIFHRIGALTIKEIEIARDFLDFIGRITISLLRLFVSPSIFRYRETAYHIEKSGFDALFIIGLTSILVGLVIAYQSIVQLAKFGADIFVVDATGIAITRELGPMITAIVVAGRSASSYTAEIGTMKLTEEISAMRTMGFDPYYFLVIPRIVALSISMPLVIFFADIVGIAGGMIATNMQVDISYSFFIDRLREVLDLKEYLLGIVKGPFFALIIAATGCFHGFRVTQDTESIGIETTASVVHAIFFVIACDALFSVIYTEMGL
jgi:phospholipid/cholesterol/gamma-HCH transport system permease protein